MNKKDCTIRIIIPIVVCIYGLVFLLNLSPLFHGMYTQDASLFLTLGKGIADGLSPYNDIFDHKGPIMFFLESLGWIVGNGSLYVAQCVTFILEIICLWISLDRVYCTSRFWLDEKRSIVILGVTILFVWATYGMGNTNEEYCVPWIAECIYLVCRGYWKHDVAREKMYVFFGIALSFVFMIRANNAALIIGAGLFLLWEDYTDFGRQQLCKDIMMGFIGISIVAVPMVIYLIYKEALISMWTASIVYNFRVVGAYTENRFIIKVLKALPIIWSLIVGVLCTYDKKIKRFIISMSIISFPCVVIGSGYWHYYAIIIPLVAFALTVFLDKQYSRRVKIVLLVSIGLCLIIYSRNMIMNVHYSVETVQNRELYASRNQRLRDLIQSIPIEERDDLMTYNAEGEYYLETDTLPNYKYFTLQSSMSNADPGINDEWNREFQYRKPKWLVFNNGKVCNNQVLIEYLNREYVLVEDFYTYSLYQKK